MSDVVPVSVDFLQEQLGVKGFYSSHDPDAVQFSERYEHVFVLSLFSHLPERTWGKWLARLYDALEPGGLLIFSTHGLQCALGQGVTLEQGYAFFASSESTAIESQVYGTTFTSPEFVQSTVRRELGADVTADVLPGHFWGQQDAVVVRR